MSKRVRKPQSEESDSESSVASSFSDFGRSRCDSDDLGYNSDNCPELGSKEKAIEDVKKHFAKELELKEGDEEEKEEEKCLHKFIKGAKKGELCGKINCRLHKKK